MIAPLRAFVADDEPLSLRRLEHGLAGTLGVEVVGKAQDGEQALRLIRSLEPDLVLLDVRMPGRSGVELAAELRGEGAPLVILVTAFSRHAVEAFDLNVVDYLLKPLDFGRLGEAVERARERLAARNGARRVAELEAQLEDLGTARGAAGAYITELWVSDRRGRTRLALDQIDWFEAEREYVRIHAGERSYLVRRSLRDLVGHLDPDRFVRLHRSALVNAARIVRICRRPGGGLSAILSSGAETPVGRTFQQGLRARLRA
jgi:DNA-binding LytR/AlgR family response regulator